MAGNKKPKRNRKGGPGRPVRPQNVKPARKAPAQTAAVANTGTVWPQMYSLQNAVHLSMQFTFQVTEWWPHDRLLKNDYSAMEVGMIAMQCPESENLHVQSESVLVEVIDIS